MSSPWFRSGIRRAGTNHRVRISEIENNKTGERAYKMEVLTIPGYRKYSANGKCVYSVKVKNPTDFEEALEKILAKRSHKDGDLLREDAKYLAKLFEDLKARLFEDVKTSYLSQGALPPFKESQK